MRYRNLSLLHGLQVLIFRLVTARQPLGALLFLLWIFSASRQCNSYCNQREECRKQDHEFRLCSFGLSVLETSGLLSDRIWMPLWCHGFPKLSLLAQRSRWRKELCCTPFNGGLGLLASKMKHLGYPLDCNVDIIRCFSLIWSNFVVGIFAARSVTDLTTARLCILGWCDEKDR